MLFHPLPESTVSQAVNSALNEALSGLQNLLANPATLAAIASAGALLAETFKNGGKVYSCGNGGSMCDAMHFAEELSGRYRLNRAALAASSISDPSHISCVGNDYGYDFIFSRYLEAHGRPGDVLVAFSTSGKSKNVLNALNTAKEKSVKVIALTGKPDSLIAQQSDISLATPAGSYADRVQELHIKLVHIMIELVERHLFPELYR